MNALPRKLLLRLAEPVIEHLRRDDRRYFLGGILLFLLLVLPLLPSLPPRATPGPPSLPFRPSLLFPLLPIPVGRLGALAEKPLNPGHPTLSRQSRHQSGR